MVIESTLPAAADAVLLPRWAQLSDAALLEHFRAPRPVHYFAVIDAEETDAQKIAGVLQGRFTFNHETHLLTEPLAWLDNPSVDVEWHILLHKFYYAVGLGIGFEQTGDPRYALRWQELINGWMRCTPPGFIAADVTGRRVQNWIYSYRYFVTHPPDRAPLAPIDPAWHRRLLESIDRQVEYLCQNLAPKRNHRTLALYAIFLAGVVFPELRRAHGWRAFALEQMARNVAEDLRPDGVHCEQSTDYHHLVLRNYLNFRKLAIGNGLTIPASIDLALERALNFSMHLHRPDGMVGSFSDGDVRPYGDLLRDAASMFKRADWLFVASGGRQGTAPAERVARFNDGGYSIVRSAWGTTPQQFSDAQHLVFDHGPLGEGNHGHFDALSFELSAYGRALLVDPGRYTYSEALEPSSGVNWRVHFRHTAAHNTVCVDGHAQTAYRPKPRKTSAAESGEVVRHKISGEPAQAQLLEHHHGKRFDLLHARVISHAYPAQHLRCIVFAQREYWIVTDWLRSSDEHDYTLNFQLDAPAAGRCRLDMKGGAQLHSPGLTIAQPALPAAEHVLTSSWVSRRYGHKQAAPALRIRLRGRDVRFVTVLMPWRERAPGLQLTSEPIDASHAALRVQIDDGACRRVQWWFHAGDDQAREWRFDRFVFHGRWLFIDDAGEHRSHAQMDPHAWLIDSASGRRIGGERE